MARDWKPGAQEDLFGFMLPGQEYTQRELAEACCLTLDQASTALASMVKRGYAQRRVLYVRSNIERKRVGRTQGFSGSMWETLSTLSRDSDMTVREVHLALPQAELLDNRAVQQRLVRLAKAGYAIETARRPGGHLYRRTDKPAPPAQQQAFPALREPQEAPQTVQAGKVYQHHRGGLYQVQALSTNVESGERLVIYHDLEHGSIHTRPLASWLDAVGPAGERRFEAYDLNGKGHG